MNKVHKILLDKAQELANYAKKNKNDPDTVNEACFAIAQIKDIIKKLNK